MKNPNPNYVPPATVSPEFRRMTEAPELKRAQGASEYITISVAEYHCLTKAATLLEVILADTAHHYTGTVAAVRHTVEEMKRTAEAGAAE